MADALVYDFLVGKDEVSTRLKTISIESSVFGQILDKNFSKAQGRLTTTSSVLKQLGIGFASTAKKGESLNDILSMSTKELDAASREAYKFDSRMLSVLFGGMALQRMFGGILKSITQTFLKAEDRTSNLSKATTRLGAAWEFFKFSLMDAFDNSFWIGIIDGVVGVINAFSNLPDWAKSGIVIGAALTYAIGTALLTWAEGALFASSMKSVITDALAGTAVTSAATTAATTTGSTAGAAMGAGFLGGLAGVLTTAAVTAVIVGAISAEDYKKTGKTTLLNVLAGFPTAGGFGITKDVNVGDAIISATQAKDKKGDLLGISSAIGDLFNNAKQSFNDSTPIIKSHTETCISNLKSEENAVDSLISKYKKLNETKTGSSSSSSSSKSTTTKSNSVRSLRDTSSVSLETNKQSNSYTGYVFI